MSAQQHPVVGDDRHPQHEVQVTVNERCVTLRGPRVTGLEIKQAAIAQGVSIQPDFVLSEELPNGKRRIVADDEIVTVHPRSRFIAIAPDDNS